LKICSGRGESEIDLSVLPDKIIVQPCTNTFKYGQLILPGKPGTVEILCFHPQPGEGCAVRGEGERPYRGGINGVTVHRLLPLTDIAIIPRGKCFVYDKIPS
jgi:hypothetical protein